MSSNERERSPENCGFAISAVPTIARIWRMDGLHATPVTSGFITFAKRLQKTTQMRLSGTALNVPTHQSTVNLAGLK